MIDFRDLLGDDGPFARALPGFTARPQQQAMAEAVAHALAHRETLVCEAGTGTGKTFAYLVPALLSGRRVIVSTGTRHLQDQLFHRDLPLVRRVLGAPVRVALLKGRANYLCLHRFELTEREGRLESRAQVAEFGAVRAWLQATRSGDLAELDALPEDSPVRSRITSTAENCLGQQCPSYADCYVLKARRAAQEADVVVINHHLLLADMVLKEEGFGDLLPGADAIIVDEAHQLPEIATQYFSQSFGSRQAQELGRDALVLFHTELRDVQAVRDAAETLDKALRDARLAFGTGSDRLSWDDCRNRPDVSPALRALARVLENVATVLTPHAERSRDAENLLRRARALHERLAPFLEETVDEWIRWCEIHSRTFTLNLTPLDTADRFRAFAAAGASTWIFTSATLAVGGSAEHFCMRAGIDAARTVLLDSPFDYARNALLYLPRDMPDPNAPQYTRAVIEAAWPVVEASGGGAFLLFTSHRALREAAALLAEREEFPLLVQGSMPKARLLDRFRALGNAVLLGTSSFWEGVDVKGPALTVVVIDKLPFAAPGDPVLAARLEAIRRAGGNPFADYQVPQAVIALKQGVGRLIRDATDRGVMMICDPRLHSRGYGKLFLASLPPMGRTRELDEVRAFLATIRGGAAANAREGTA